MNIIKRYLPILLLPLLVASCFKYVGVDNTLNYTISGFHDVTIDQNDSGYFYVSAQLLSGNPANEYITFTVSGLPDGVSVNQDSITFRPNYSFALVFYGHAPQPGVYPITVKTVSPTMGVKVYTFNLTVTSLFDCTGQFSRSHVPSLYGSFQVEMSGGYGNDVYGYIHRTGPDTINIQIMKDSMEPGSEPDGVPLVVADFSAIVNCSANTLSILPQTDNGFHQPGEMIRGRGTFVTQSDSTATTTITDTIYIGSETITANTITIY